MARRSQRTVRAEWAAVVSAVLLLARPATAAPTAEQQAREILQATGVRGGLVVHLGCGDGALTAALHAGEGYLVHGLDADAATVARAREHIRKLGLYGPVSVAKLEGKSLPYADNLVNLLVAERRCGVADDEILRVLAPCGVAYVKGPDDKWAKTVKPRPANIDEWTHWLHDASGNAVAKDTVVGPPRRVQWVEGPKWQRHHELNANPDALVSAGGRIFYICDEAPATVTGLPDQWALIARDAFNGVLLWKRPIAAWGWKQWSTREAGGRFNVPVYISRRLVAVGDRLYATLGFNAPLSALDAATGEVVKTYDGTEFTDEIMYRDGTLILSVNEAAQKPGLISEAPPVKKQVVALDARTGKVLWRQGDYVGISSKADSFERITHLALAVGPEHVYFVEEDAIVCLDLKTGRQLWRAPRPQKHPQRGHVPYNPPNLCTLVAHDGVALLAQPEEPYTRKTWDRGVKCVLTALSAATGKVRWSHPCSKWGPGVKADVFVIDGLVWVHAAGEYALIGLDVNSGEVKRKFSTKEALHEVHHHRCFRNKATTQYVLTARRGIELLDLTNETCEKNHWVRGACRYGILPCNGLIYAPPHPCQCYVAVKLNGFYALAPAGSEARTATTGDTGNTEKTRLATKLSKNTGSSGAWNPQSAIHNLPAGRQVRNLKDWPTYRHDGKRSGSTTAAVAGRLVRLWEADVCGAAAGAGEARISPCTVANGTVFAAAIDQHRVCAMDAADGKLRWDYVAGGRVDTPPTVYGRLVLFGSVDGWVHCLRASDGKLVWRLRAAPRERQVVAFGQLESAWPVHGTVLVSDGVAYVAAGRSSYLDGGIRVLAVEPETGRVIRELKPLNNDPHGLEDVLVADGGSVYMRQLRFSLNPPSPPTGAEKKGKQAAKGKAGKAASKQKRRGKAAVTSRAFSTAGLLDDSWFCRVGWGGGKGGAELMVFDDASAYAVRTKRKGGFGGWFQPASGAYTIVATDRTMKQTRWSKTVAIRPRAMVLADTALFIAGPPDVVETSDPWAAFEGRKGALLRAFATADGSKLAEYPLDAAPVYDGLIAAGGRLYLSTRDGKVVCLAGKS